MSILKNISNNYKNDLLNLPTPVMKIDKEFNILFMNNAGAALKDMKPNACIGMKCYDFFNTKQCNTDDCACFLAMRDDKQVTMETVAIPKKGLILPISYTGVPTKNSSGKITGALEFIVDTTELKKVENNLVNLPTPVMEIDSDFNIKFMNKSGAALGNLTEEECVGMKCYDFFKTGQCKTDDCACFLAMRDDKQVTMHTTARPKNGVEIPITYTGAPVKDNNGNIIGALEFIINQTVINDIITNLTQSSQVLGTNVNTLAVSSTQLTGASKELSSVTATTTSAMEEITTNIAQISERSSRSSTDISTVATGTEEIKMSMDTVSASIGQLAESFQEIVSNTQNATNVTDNAVTMSDTIATVMKTLKTEAENIGDFVDVITGIASQTNLLALNATIEAARAGDAGKGFAVVANEVKELSKQTTHSADDVASKIDGIQNVSVDSSNKIDKIAVIMKTIQTQNQTVASTVEEQSAISKEIATTVSDSVNAVGEVAKSVGLIRDSIKSITQAIEEVSVGMNEISKGTNTINSSSEESNQQAVSLDNQVTELTKLKDGFDKIINNLPKF